MDEEIAEFTDLLNAHIGWENELDAMGAWPNIFDSIQMLSKAPAESKSKQSLVNYIQELASA